MSQAKIENKDECVCCGSRQSIFVTDKLRYQKPGTVVRCVQCGLVRLTGALDFEKKATEFYREQYAAEYHRGIKSKLDTLFNSFYPVQQERIERLDGYLRKTDKLIEIGSSVGYFLYAVRKYVSEVYGIEYNIQEAGYATQEKGIPTDTRALSDSKFKTIKFDHICLFQLLEHIHNPITFLQELRNHLSPQGYIHIEIPNIKDPLVSLYDNVAFRDFFYQEPHLYYFDPQTLEKVISKTGLNIVAIEPFQQTSITNTLHWIYRNQPQPSRWDCIQTILPSTVLDVEGTSRVKSQIDELMQKVNREFKKILIDNGFADNIFCTLQHNG